MTAITAINAQSRSWLGCGGLLFVAALLLFAFPLGGLRALGWERGSTGLPAPRQGLVYIRGWINEDIREHGVYAVDVERDEVVGGPFRVTPCRSSFQSGMALAPNGKLYLLRCPKNEIRLSPFGGGGLLVLDPNDGWRRIEPSIPNDVGPPAVRRLRRQSKPIWRSTRVGWTYVSAGRAVSDPYG